MSFCGLCSCSTASLCGAHGFFPPAKKEKWARTRLMSVTQQWQNMWWKSHNSSALQSVCGSGVKCWTPVIDIRVSLCLIDNWSLSHNDNLKLLLPLKNNSWLFSFKSYLLLQKTKLFGFKDLHFPFLHRFNDRFKRIEVQYVDSASNPHPHCVQVRLCSYVYKTRAVYSVWHKICDFLCNWL